MSNIVYLLVMVPGDDAAVESAVRELLAQRYGTLSQVQLLGDEDRTIHELWRAQQRILARRQEESRT